MKDRKRGDRIVITELDNTRLDLVIAHDTAALRSQKPPIIAKDPCLSIGRKKKGVRRSPRARVIADVGATTLKLWGNLLDTRAGQIYPFRECIVVLK